MDASAERLQQSEGVKGKEKKKKVLEVRGDGWTHRDKKKIITQNKHTHM
jgi:hypothetical protein